MSFENDFLDLMPHEVTIEPLSSQNEHGEFTYGAAVTYSARVTGKIRRVIGIDGREVTSMKTIYLGPGVQSISTRDRITLPPGHEPQTPPILSIDFKPDEDGLHHVVVYC